MSNLTTLARRILKFVGGIVQTVGFLSAVITILIVLGISTSVFGHTLLLIIVGASIVAASLIVFIICYTFLEGKAKVKAVSNASSGDTVKESEKPGFAPTDTISYPPPPSEDVEILLKDIYYEYLPDGKTMYQRKHLEMQIIQNGVKLFHDRFRWTGSGKCIIRSLTPGYEIRNHYKSEEEIWDFFDVIFPYAKHKGEIVKFTIEWELFDDKGIAVPFLSTMIDRETKYLKLEVKLPNELAPKQAYFYEFKNYIDTLPVTTKPISWSPAARTLKYEVPNPIKYHKYLIRWYPEE